MSAVEYFTLEIRMTFCSQNNEPDVGIDDFWERECA